MKELKQIGEYLTSKGLISPSDLKEALDIQKKWGSPIGEILINKGKIRAIEFYKVLAEQLNIPFVNLLDNEVEEKLILAEDQEFYTRYQAIPWKRNKKNKLVIATSDPNNEDMRLWAYHHLGDCEFVITSPFDILWTVSKKFSSENDHKARLSLYEKSPEFSARGILHNRNMIVGVLLYITLAFLAFLPGKHLIYIVLMLNTFYLTTLAAKIHFFIIGSNIGKFWKGIKENKPDITGISDKSVPVYTILIPMYKESKTTISNLLESIRNLDYPKSKLDVKLVVEEGDNQTIDIIKSQSPERFFEIIVTPHSLPKTKPKACNYALSFAKGEYLTIYDAEDRPDPLQLKRVLKQFKDSNADIACIQCRLNYYNRRENFLTRMFSLEYATWFDFMLPGLQSLSIPMPLGGTSNHIKLEKLKELGAWDPYNVTEDADLGMRIAHMGYKVEVNSSLTEEEAPINLLTWFRQRTRWIKGHMQTVFVQTLQIDSLIKTVGIGGVSGFLVFLAAPFCVFLTIPLAIIATLNYISLSEPASSMLMAFVSVNFVLGIVSHIIIALWVCYKRGWYKMMPYSFLFPAYWILHIIASFMAFNELVLKPYQWNKTPHGVSKMFLVDKS